MFIQSVNKQLMPTKRALLNEVVEVKCIQIIPSRILRTVESWLGIFFSVLFCLAYILLFISSVVSRCVQDLKNEQIKALERFSPEVNF